MHNIFCAAIATAIICGIAPCSADAAEAVVRHAYVHITAISYEDLGAANNGQIQLTVKNEMADLIYVPLRIECMSIYNEMIVQYASLAGTEPQLGKVILARGKTKQFSIAAPYAAVVQSCQVSIPGGQGVVNATE